MQCSSQASDDDEALNPPPPPPPHTHTRRSCATFQASASLWDLPASICLLAPKTRLASASDFTSFRLLACLLLALHAAVAVAAFAITGVVWFLSFFFFFWFWFWFCFVFFLGSHFYRYRLSLGSSWGRFCKWSCRCSRTRSSALSISLFVCVFLGPFWV